MFSLRKRVLTQTKIVDGGFTNETCLVCLGTVEKAHIAIQLPCKHIFHPSCLGKWERSTRMKRCAVCNQQYCLSVWHSLDNVQTPRFGHKLCGLVRYNHRYKPSMFNLVLCELRRYIRNYRNYTEGYVRNQCFPVQQLLDQTKDQIGKKFKEGYQWYFKQPFYRIKKNVRRPK